jgi:excisionase family DNA binding protein
MKYQQSDGVAGWLTVMGVSRLLGVSYPAAYKFLRKSKLPTIRVGAALLVRVEDVQRKRASDEQGAIRG